MKNRNSLSLTTLILGCLSLVPLLGFITGILALIFGIISIIQINKKSEKGKSMTLTGLSIGLVGLVLWGIIYGSLIGSYNKSMKDGTFDKLSESGTKSNLATIVGKIEIYKKENGKYPENLNFLDNDKTTFITDFYGNNFCYKVTENGYDLRSKGKDGKVGTKDDILP